MEQADWPNLFTEDIPPFSDFIRSKANTVVVRDPQLRKDGKHARAQLRSVPLFRFFEMETVIHTDLWDNDFKLIDYESIAADRATGVSDDLEFPLVHVTTQDHINDGEEELVRALLNRAANEDGRYVLVTETTSPKTPTYTRKPGRSIVDDFDVTVQDYETLSTRLHETVLDPELPLARTRNMYYHLLSAYHGRQGHSASTLEELFGYSKIPSQSPAWEPLYYFVEHDLESVLTNYSERIREALRSWTERGETQKIANQMIDTLHVCEYNRANLDEYRRRDPELR
ncbi:hypothetical protein [Halosimplex sp. TS25]|uniref:hypothetical protein n=1 Tax=Halosimplex rarum TaxID=3396619 RepID=UPI0039ED3FA0